MVFNMVKEKVIAGTATAIVAASMIFSITYYNKNESLKTNLDDEKLKSEQLLSEKLQVDKEVARLQTDMEAQKGKNAELDKFLSNASSKLEEKQKQIDKMMAENKKVKSLQKDLADIQKIRTDLDKQLGLLQADAENMHKNMEKLQAENSSLSQQLAVLEQQNNTLAKNNIALQAQRSSDYLTEAYRGRNEDKLTATAKRTKKLVASFAVEDASVKDYQFTITSPDGRVIKSTEDKNIHIEMVKQEVITGTQKKSTADAGTMNRISMTYEAPEKLSAGVYTIDIYNTASKHIGSCKINLK